MQVVLLRIGIDSGCGGMQSALLKNNRFEYIPIPDKFGIDKRNYSNVRGRYGKYLIDYFSKGRRKKMAKQSIHFDPEFTTFTYGDPTTPKRSLRKLNAGDLLVFYCGLSKWDPHNGMSKHTHDLYMMGYFEVKQAGYATQFGIKNIRKHFRKNFHVMHRPVFQKQKNHLVLVKGNNKSRFFNKAVQISSNGKDKNGTRLKIISPKMRKIFGNFGGSLSIQRSNPKWVQPQYVVRATKFVRAQH